MNRSPLSDQPPREALGGSQALSDVNQSMGPPTGGGDNHIDVATNR